VLRYTSESDRIHLRVNITTTNMRRGSMAATFDTKLATILSLIYRLFFGAFLVAEALQFPINDRVKVQTAPLIEGPSWLPVHCKVIVDDSHVFDYIPMNAASKDTLFKLVTLQAVPATVRITIKNGDKTNDNSGDSLSLEPYVERAIQFSEEYNQDLHLVNNNCWSFAFDLLRTTLNP